MTITELPRRGAPAVLGSWTRGLAAAAAVSVLLALALSAAGCNPLDPSKIEPSSFSDGGPCGSGCSSTQVCLKSSDGTCGCYDRCDDSLCTAGSCVFDPTVPDNVCVDLAQILCQ
jgi:hypothetical protein